MKKGLTLSKEQPIKDDEHIRQADKLNRIFEKLDEPLQDFVVQQLDILLWAQGKYYKEEGSQQPEKQRKLSNAFIDRIKPFQRFSMFLEGKRKNSPDT